VAGENPLPRLRRIRDEIRRIDALIPQRDRLIREAVEQGYSERQIAKAAGVHHTRVNQIKHSR
jgi:hypothetical protein